MKKFRNFGFILFFYFLCTAAEAKSTDILGVWWSPTKDGKVLIYKNKKTFSGKLLAVSWEKGKNKDDKNPNIKLRKKSILGLKFIKGFTYDAESKEWSGGSVYDMKNGKTYTSKMWLDGKRNLNIRGFVGISLFGRTAIFTKVKGPRPMYRQKGEPRMAYLKAKGISKN